MRKLATATLALPILGFVYLTTFIHRSILTKVLSLALVTALVAAGLLVGLPSKGVSAKEAPKYDPKAPTAQANIVTELGLGSAFGIEFSKPMDEASVAASLTVIPEVAYHATWDSTGRTLSLVPDDHWTPNTYYTVDVAATALDRDSLKLGQVTHASFLTATPTTGKFSASTVVGDSIAPTTSFVLTFSGPVKLTQVEAAFNILPLVSGKITGDDPTNANSQVFTFTPDAPLALGTSYVASFSAATMVDAAGAPLAWVAPFKASTQAVPSVVRFRPLDGTTGVDPGQAISVRFTTKMDEATTTPAFSVTSNGKPVTGKTYWAEDDTVLVLTPTAKFAAGAKIVAAVSTDATSSGGLHLKAAATATSTVDKPSSVKVPYSTGALGVGNSQWAAAENYYLQLMNCTRTGGWVVSGGLCRSSGPHTLPPARALMLDAGISTSVARPFAKFMADRGILNHYANGTPGQRLARAGYTSSQWGENIGSPSSVMAGMVAVEIFYQNEAPCRCEHYKNLMNPAYDRAGIGVWVTAGRVRVVIDLYHP